MNAKSIYDKSPAFLQDVFLTFQAFKYRSFRKGGQYKNFVDILNQTEHYTSEQVFGWKIQQFRKVFGEAYNNTAYYKRIFDEAGINPFTIENFDFLKKLPILTKSELRESPKDFINKERKIVYTAKTGGTTGAPLETPFDAESTQWASAYLTRFFQQVGVRYGSRNVHMTGQQVVPLNEKRKFWRTDMIGNSLYLSIHHLGPNTFTEYWSKILKFKPNYIFGYTSFIYELARYININNNSGKVKLKGVFPSSEKLTDDMRKEMMIAFDCHVYDHYGSTEGIPLITQCKNGKYHVVPESGIIEFIDSEGLPAKPGEPSEMIMTSLRQFSRPLLRYKIGDTAIYSNESCSCGLHWPVISELTGRLSEWITLQNGRRVSQFSHQVFKLVSSVVESRIIQHTYTDFELLIVKGDKYGSAEEDFIRKRIFELIGSSVNVQFKYMKSIPKTGGGKKPTLISKVS